MNEITKHTPRGNVFQIALWAIKRELQMRKQITFVYCPCCNFEMCSMNNATDMKNGNVYHICLNCGNGSEWYYDLPAPLIIK